MGGWYFNPFYFILFLFWSLSIALLSFDWGLLSHPSLKMPLPLFTLKAAREEPAGVSCQGLRLSNAQSPKEAHQAPKAMRGYGWLSHVMGMVNEEPNLSPFPNTQDSEKLDCKLIPIPPPWTFCLSLKPAGGSPTLPQGPESWVIFGCLAVALITVLISLLPGRTCHVSVPLETQNLWELIM